MQYFAADAEFWRTLYAQSLFPMSLSKINIIPTVIRANNIMMKKIKDKLINFCKWVWSECKDWHTLVLFLVVVFLMYAPVWGGYLLHILFKIKWGSVVATTYLAFWAGPFTPYFPLCIAITLGIKRLFEKRKNNYSNKADENENSDN